MRVAYDLTALQLNASGVARWATALRAALAATGEVELVDVAQPVRSGAGGRVARGLLREASWLPSGLGAAALRSGADLLHCPAPLAPWRGSPLPLVLNVFDVMPLRRPQWFTAANRWHARLLLPRMVREAEVVLAPSEFSRQDLLDAVGGLDPERIVVVPGGIDARFSPGARFGAGSPYLITVGELQPRKNLETALAAFARLAPRHPELELRVVGAHGWGDAPVGADRVRFLGRVDDDDLVELYRGAAALLFPSRYEGFGLPVLEAMACGAPVVAARASSLPEVVGDAGLLADPNDPRSWEAAVERIVSEPGLASALRERGLACAAEYTWERSARLTLAAYGRATRLTPVAT